MSKVNVPHPKNAPGPFYVVNGCCMACMVPQVIAPTLMGFDEVEKHCFFSRQPENEEEVYRAIRAVWSSELQCLRYGGTDVEVLRRLAEIDASDACDQQPPPGASLVLRNHVTFKAAFALQPWDVASVLRVYILSLNSDYVKYKVTPLEHDGVEVKLAYSWYEDLYHSMWIGRDPGNGERWLVWHSRERRSASVGISIMLDDWLREDARFDSIQWYTAESWESGSGVWRERAY
jgi:hypothetical protein